MPIQSPTNDTRNAITGQVRITAGFAETLTNEIHTTEQLRTKIEQTPRTEITEIIHILLVAALIHNASDIHIEPEEDGIQVRFRIDGLLQDVAKLSLALHEKLLSRLKLTAGTKINITDKPQDGRFSFFVGTTTIEARVSTLPTAYGETVVIRVLNPKNLITIYDLGLEEALLQRVQATLKKPHGMVIVTGPTGSGKTSTLYAFLKEVNHPEIKMITIEDPIEYHLDGVSQTQVNTARGYTFASGLQAIVRQDPDVILVGEVRDQDTAQIAVQAALTGHLVFTTLHANDAASTISRLRSLKAKSHNIAAAMNLIIGQRLVRKLCDACKTTQPATAEQTRLIQQGLEHIPPHFLKDPLPKTIRVGKPGTCAACNNTGYRGRIGIFEIVVTNDAFEEFILTKPSTSALRAFAVQQGMITMYQDGLLKILQHITTLEEVQRITGE